MSSDDILNNHLIVQGRNVRLQQVTCLTLLGTEPYPGSRKVEEMDRVLDHLSRTFEDRFFNHLFADGATGEEKKRSRPYLHVSQQLESIGDSLVEMARIQGGAGEQTVPPEILDLGQKSIRTLTAVLEAFFQGEISLAKNACEMCLALEQLCQDHLLSGLDKNGSAGAAGRGSDSSMPLLHIQCLRRILLAQLKIAESTIYLISGERLSFSQYMHLERLAKEAGARTGCFSFQNLWGGISGAVVGKLDLGEKGQWVFKDGISKKILPEVENLKKWDDVLEGLVPKLVAVGGEEGDTQSFLSEFVEGTLLSDIFLHGMWEEKVEALLTLHETLRRIWDKTRVEETPPVSYVRQIRDRLPAVFNQHLRLKKIRQSASAVSDSMAPSLLQLLDRAGELEGALAPPFSVMLHGDFNANNIMFNQNSGSIRFIDIHRSKPGDLVQDLGVFLVSGIRNPLVKMTVLGEVLRLNEMTVEFARKYSLEHGDSHFDDRLRLSRARSFITSSRLISDFRFAKELFLEGLYHLDQFYEEVNA